MLLPDTYYHIYNRANGQDNLFLTDENYRYFLKRYADFIYPIADTFAYCLMPNHFHFLIKTRDIEAFNTLPKFKNLSNNLDATTLPKFKTLEEFNDQISKYISKQFSNLFSSYTQSFNKVYKRHGSLFQKNFKYKEVGHDAYFTTLIHYIHANPVHHGFCKDLRHWPHSSFDSILSEKKSLLQKQYVRQWFGGDKDYISFHKQPIHPKIALDMEI